MWRRDFRVRRKFCSPWGRAWWSRARPDDGSMASANDLRLSDRLRIAMIGCRSAPTHRCQQCFAGLLHQASGDRVRSDRLPISFRSGNASSLASGPRKIGSHSATNKSMGMRVPSMCVRRHDLRVDSLCVEHETHAGRKGRQVGLVELHGMSHPRIRGVRSGKAVPIRGPRNDSHLGKRRCRIAASSGYPDRLADRRNPRLARPGLAKARHRKREA